MKNAGLVMTAIMMVALTSCMAPATPVPPVTPTGTSAAPSGLPDMPVKPQPVEITYNGCPPQGDGGDPVLNRLKNRVDEGIYIPVTFDALFQLTWPKGVERRDHAEWSPADAAAIARYEGIPVWVEGYLADAKEQGPESTNCHGNDLQSHDFHIWLTKTVGEDRSQSIVVEATPRVRPSHPGWTVRALERIAKNQQRVRISGWVMFDPEHPDQVGQTRGTIWEIHPIMQIEVEQQGKWVALDNLAP